MKYIMMTLALLFTTSINAQEEKIEFEKITLGAGCFWCVEAVFEELNGVVNITSGYMGGKTEDPSYKEVCSGFTGHAEVVQLVYDKDAIALEEILEVFFMVHDPTTLNRQGADVGTQYRSVIFYENDEQKDIAIAVKRKLNTAKIWDDPIVTELSPASEYYIAEDYHQDYYALNKKDNNYCRLVITPKLEKFRKAFKDRVK